MEKFEFLLGDWNLEYRIPKSAFSEARSELGTGTIKRALNDRYVIFNYSTESSGEAIGIFVRDEKINAYRYWWFENSGNFLTATANFINDETLHLNWHDTLLIQTFTKESRDRVSLKMKHPEAQGKYELLMEVILTRKK